MRVGITAAAREWVRRTHSLVGINNERLLVVLAVLAVIIAVESPYFLTPANILNIGQAVAVVGVLAVAQTVVIVSRGLDISVGSAAGLCAVVAAAAMTSTHNGAVGLAVALSVGALAGLVNGLTITVGRVNPVIATLATLSAYKGIALLVAHGSVINITDGAYNSIGSGRVFGVPIVILVLLGVMILAHVLLRYTVYGRHIYAMGGNPAAARLAGLAINRYKLAVYIMSGVSAGVAGIMLSSRATAASALAGEGVEFDVVTAAVLGGAGLAGGRGTIAGTMLGVLILGTLFNGMILAQVEPFWQFIAKGGLLAVAVIIQERRRPR